jgi:hypothetical protein
VASILIRLYQGFLRHVSRFFSYKITLEVNLFLKWSLRIVGKTYFCKSRKKIIVGNKRIKHKTFILQCHIAFQIIGDHKNYTTWDKIYLPKHQLFEFYDRMTVHRNTVGWNRSSILLLVANCSSQLHKMYQSRCTAKNSWWWAESLPETCRVVKPMKLEFSASVGFIRKESLIRV